MDTAEPKNHGQTGVSAADPLAGDALKTSASTSPPSEDPRELAKRLAAEAKARAASQQQSQAAERPTSSKPVVEEIKRPKSGLAGRAPPAAALAPKTPPPPVALPIEHEPSPMPTAPRTRAADPEKPVREATPDPAVDSKAPSLADRARRKKVLSAEEAMRVHAEQEEKAKEEQAKAEAQAKTKKETAPAKPKADSSHAHDPAAILKSSLPACKIKRLILLQNTQVLVAVWQAHRARAIASSDVALAATAAVVLDAATRVPAGKLAAAHVAVSGTEHAVWLDLDRGVLLGIASPPAVYLAGF